MHSVRRAIIMAAGRGNRLRPVTDTLPKPLIPVHGVPMIVGILEALRSQGIEETYVVTGYRKEDFRFLETAYPGVTLIENPYYESCNNISSLYVAREHLSDVIILDGDQVVRNPDILRPDFVRSGYNAVWTEEETGEWLMTVENDRVTGCSRTGGSRGWQLYSVSRWSAEDGARLRQDVAEAFESGNRQIYWDDVPLFVYPEHYELGVWPMAKEDLMEIDSLEELRAEDPAWREKTEKV